MVVPLRKSRGGQFLNPLGSPEEMDLEEVSVGETGLSLGGEQTAGMGWRSEGWEEDLGYLCSSFGAAREQPVWEGWFGSPCCSFAGAQGVLCLLQLVQDIARLRRRSLRHSRQLDFPKPYIAARFRSLPSHFILGDMKHYDNFENRALEPGQKYVLFILAVLQEPEAVSAACFP